MMQSFFGDRINIDDVFNQNLVDCLPGVFYVYLLEDGVAKMKIWNKFHEKVFGYSGKNYVDKSPLFYIDPEYHDVIIKAVSTLDKEGVVKQVLANILTKSGKSVPFIFEGYRFQVEDKTYFTGLGLDISDLVSAKEQIQILALEKQKIAENIDKQEKKLLALALQENKNSFLLNTISLKLKNILKSKDLDYIDRETRKLLHTLSYEEKTKNNWEQFKKSFVNVHEDFLENLKAKHADLTHTELIFCSYLKINMSSADLCAALNISKDGLKKKRYRLKKKLQLEGDASVKGYISSF